MEDIIRRLRILIEGKGPVESSRNNSRFPCWLLGWELFCAFLFVSLLLSRDLCEDVKNNRQVMSTNSPAISSRIPRKKEKEILKKIKAHLFYHSQ